MNELSSKKVLYKCLPGCCFIFGSHCYCHGRASDSEIDAVPQLFHGLHGWLKSLYIHRCESSSSECLDSMSGVLQHRRFLKEMFCNRKLKRLAKLIKPFTNCLHLVVLQPQALFF